MTEMVMIIFRFNIQGLTPVLIDYTEGKKGRWVGN